MKNELKRTQTVVKKSPIHGYGVFAAQDFRPDDIIEECYFLRVDKQATEFINYYFAAGDDKAMVLGDGSIYNHSLQPNARHVLQGDHDIMVVRACQPIRKGEEIFICYGNNWFDSRCIGAKERSWLSRHRSPIMLVSRFLVVILLMAGLITFVDTMSHSGFAHILSQQQ